MLSRCEAVAATPGRIARGTSSQEEEGVESSPRAVSLGAGEATPMLHHPAGEGVLKARRSSNVHWTQKTLKLIDEGSGCLGIEAWLGRSRGLAGWCQPAAFGLDICRYLGTHLVGRCLTEMLLPQESRCVGQTNA